MKTMISKYNEAQEIEARNVAIEKSTRKDHGKDGQSPFPSWSAQKAAAIY